jgi:hypothetical protein
LVIASWNARWCAPKAGQTTEMIFSLTTHMISQAKNPSTAPNKIRSIDLSYLF